MNLYLNQAALRTPEGEQFLIALSDLIQTFSQSPVPDEVIEEIADLVPPERRDMALKLRELQLLCKGCRAMSNL